MAFGFNTNSDIKPRVKYDAKAGRLFRVDRVEEAGRWVNHDIDITKTFACLLNVNSACVGWVDFTNAPIMELVVPYVDGQAPPPKPQWENARPTVEFQVKLASECGGDLRRFASSAMSVIDTFGALREQILKAPEHSAGKVPAIVLADVEAVKTQHGTNYVPVWEIVSWHDAPEGFEPAEAMARGSGAPAPAPVSATVADDPHADDIPFSPAGAGTAATPPAVASGGTRSF